MYEKIYVPEPSFWKAIVWYITELEKLRNHDNLLSSQFREIPLRLFFELKTLFQLVESISSARIEWNRTTIAQYINDTSWSDSVEKISSQSIIQIDNIYRGISFIEEQKKLQWELRIDRAFIQNLHVILMRDLDSNDEWCRNPWEYRTEWVTITRSSHIAPDALQVAPFMEELIDFIENYEKDKRWYDFLKIAIAHHRFVWIHPFQNGNGRMVRLLTYAMLIKYGFDVADFWLVNPSSLFCIDRQRYYDFLWAADCGEKWPLLDWCQYAIESIFAETKMLEQLGKKDFVINIILNQALDRLIEKGMIDNNEKKILMIAYNTSKAEFALKDVKGYIDLSDSSISLKFKHLIDIDLITYKENKKAIYVPLLSKNHSLFYAIYSLLAKNGFNSWLSLDE